MGFPPIYDSKKSAFISIFSPSPTFSYEVCPHGTVFVKDGVGEGKEEESSISGWFNQGRLPGDTKSYDQH